MSKREFQLSTTNSESELQKGISQLRVKIMSEYDKIRVSKLVLKGESSK